MGSASGYFSGVIFIGAGLYQFSALKHSCLTHVPATVSVFLRELGHDPAPACSGWASQQGASIASAASGDDAGDALRDRG